MKKNLLILFVLASFLWMDDGLAAQKLTKTVAVFEFENDSGYRSWRHMGRDFSDQLSDALVQSGQFTVLSRKDLGAVLAEQNLAGSDRVAKSNTAQTGKIIPAQILVKGKIADFEENTSGGNKGIKIKGFKVGAKKSSAHIGLLVQLIDSTTGEILTSKRVDATARGGGLSFGYDGDFDINSSNFKKTPVGKAVQKAIDQAVEFIAQGLSNVPWSGKVVTVKDGLVFINAGSGAGVSTGDTFTIFREGEALIDPDTGINLGGERTKIGSVKVSNVQEKFSKATADGFNADDVSRGDIVLE